MIQSKNTLISVISPVYGAQGIIDKLANSIQQSVEKITGDYEIILIEDHSPDNSWQEIVTLAKSNKKIRGVKLSRNFGQHNAISAGMEIAVGDYVVVLDCDLQHNPKYIYDLYQKIQEGHDLVYARLLKREHSVLKNSSSKLFYWLLKTVGGIKWDANIGTYSILSRKVVDAYNMYNDYRKAYSFALKWVGFQPAIINIPHEKRTIGKSSYNLRKLITLSLDTSISNSDRILYFSFYTGIITSLLSFLGIFIVIFRYFTMGSLQGWTSLIVVIMFFSGLILTTLGITSIYLARVYEQTKGRPRYLISEKVNL